MATVIISINLGCRCSVEVCNHLSIHFGDGRLVIVAPIIVNRVFGLVVFSRRQVDEFEDLIDRIKGEKKVSGQVGESLQLDSHFGLWIG